MSFGKVSLPELRLFGYHLMNFRYPFYQEPYLSNYKLTPIDIISFWNFISPSAITFSNRFTAMTLCAKILLKTVPKEPPAQWFDEATFLCLICTWKASNFIAFVWGVVRHAYFLEIDLLSFGDTLILRSSTLRWSQFFEGLNPSVTWFFEGLNPSVMLLSRSSILRRSRFFEGLNPSVTWSFTDGIFLF